MQRRPQPLTPLAGWVMLAMFAVAFLAVVRYAAGGWRGLMHRRLRGPIIALALFGAMAIWGKWLVDQHQAGSASDRAAGIGSALILCGLIALAATFLVAWSRFTARWNESSRIVGDLTAILDSERQHFLAEVTTAERPLELLDALSDLLGPGSWVPGHEWATQQWVADRVQAASMLKPGGTNSRIEKHPS